MTSNYFAGYSANIKPPAVCHAPIDPWPPWIPGSWPYELYAYAKWKDFGAHPNFLYQANQLIQQVGDGPHWAGSSSAWGRSMAIDVQIDVPTLTSTIALNIQGPYRPPPGETYTWFNAPTQIEPSIEIFYVLYVDIPFIAYAEAHIMQ